MKKSERILIVDDDADDIEARAELLRSNGYEVVSAETGAAALDIVRCQSIGLTLLDLQLGGEKGFDLLPQLKKLRPEMSVIILTGHGTIDNAFDAMRLGADYFMEKYIQPPSFLTLIEKGLESYRLRRKNLQLERISAPPRQALIYNPDGAMRRVMKEAEAVAGRDTTVLLRGENGTGKGLLASYLHQISPRQTEPFVHLNCAGLPRELTESELFGHERGAFTDAKTRKIGLFEAAHGGILFLDEIGDMDLAVQAKLLNAIEQKRFRRVGGITEIEVDVRLIAATHRDLASYVAEGRFREDLLFRLNVFPIDLPPLRERREDILPLVAHFLREFCGTQIPGLSPAATEQMLAHAWPGNVRELRNVIERATIRCPPGSEILPMHLGLPELSSESKVGTDSRLSRADEAPASTSTILSEAMEQVEQELIAAALKRNNWIVAVTARELGIARETLHQKINKYHLSREE